jgi:predicted transcriptional regulator of viral defense system
MVVYNKNTSLEKIRGMLSAQNGILRSADLEQNGIPRIYLSILVKDSKLRRISRGVYAAINILVDEMVIIQARFKNANFSHGTALYLLDLTDRTPLTYTVTVPSGYNATSLKADGVRVFFVKRELRELGAITLSSPYGNNIQTYNPERTICDILRNRNQLDIQIVNEALKRYATRKDRDIHQLYQYASQFRIEKIVRNNIEILL